MGLIREDVADLAGSPRNGAAVDLSSVDANYTPATKVIHVGNTGDVKIDYVDSGTGITLKNVPVGKLEVRASKIYKTGTTATNMVAMW